MKKSIYSSATRHNPSKKKEDQEGLFYAVEVIDKGGVVVARRTGRSKSYCRGWNQIINEYASGGVGPNIIDVDGASRSPNNSSYLFLSCVASIGADGLGIRVGRGITAVTINDYRLEIPCSQGSGANQFAHQQMQFFAPVIDGSSSYFKIKRVLLNLSGGNIVVSEIGCYNQFFTVSAPYALLGFRDVFSAVTVPDGGAITVTYTLKVTV